MGIATYLEGVETKATGSSVQTTRPPSTSTPTSTHLYAAHETTIPSPYPS